MSQHQPAPRPRAAVRTRSIAAAVLLAASGAAHAIDTLASTPPTPVAHSRLASAETPRAPAAGKTGAATAREAAAESAADDGVGAFQPLALALAAGLLMAYIGLRRPQD